MKETREKPDNVAKITNPKFVAFAMWIAAGPTLGTEMFEGVVDQNTFGRKFKIAACTMSRWKNVDEFWNLVTRLRRRVFAEKLGDAVNALFKKAARTGDAAEVKLAAQLAGELKDDGIDLKVPAEVSDAIKKIAQILP